MTSQAWLWGHREPGRSWYGLVQNQTLLELHCQIDGKPQLSDCQFQARVTAIERPLNAAFVEMQDRAKTTAMLKLPKKQKLLEGQSLWVKVLAEPREGKHPKVNLAPEDCALDLSNVGDRLIARYKLGSAYSNAARLTEEWRSRWPNLKVSSLDSEIDQSLIEVRDHSLRQSVELDQKGAWIKVEELETLTAIDVNSGALAPAQANALALPAIAREIRRRNLGGIIVVDALGLETKPERQIFDKQVASLFAADPWFVSANPVDPNGILIITRRRWGLSLNEALSQTQSLKAAPETQALDLLAQAKHQLRIQDPALRVPASMTKISIWPQALAELEKDLGYKIKLEVLE